MSQFRLSAEAQADLAEIWSYVAQDSFQAADRVLDRIYEAMLKLAAMPLMGHLREDLVDEPLRFWSVYS